MAIPRKTKGSAKRILSVLAAFELILELGCTAFQRSILYHPTHHQSRSGLSEWRLDGKLIGYSREVFDPRSVWLMLHGNAGQADDRSYALPSFSMHDSVFILEYPGYGLRRGSPNRETIDSAAREAYGLLRARFKGTPVCVVGESIGSGAASILASEAQPPDKIVLIVPFDRLSRVATDHIHLVPAALILFDNWNNIEALSGYRGRLEIFGAHDDTVIPIVHVRALGASMPAAAFHEIPGGHNDWSYGGRVAIRNP